MWSPGPTRRGGAGGRRTSTDVALEGDDSVHAGMGV